MKNSTRFFLLPVVALLALALNGCVSIKMVGEYDEQTDVAVTQIQRKMEQFLTGLERNIGRESASYDNNTKFYDDIMADVSAARVRVAAIPENDYINQQLGFLRLNIINLENTHKVGITRDDIPLIRTTFNNSCTSILRLELAKKRGRS